MRVYAIDKKNEREMFERRLNYNFRLVYQIGCATGLRVTDILCMEKKILEKKEPTIREKKTGKSKRIYIPKKLKNELIEFSKNNDRYIFESKASKTGHITRQAVWKHYKKVAKAMNIQINIGTHTMRKNKVYQLMQKGKSLKYIKNELNHTNLSDTLLYMMNP